MPCWRTGIGQVNMMDLEKVFYKFDGDNLEHSIKFKI